MKNLRKALSLALVVALSLSLAVAAGAKNVGDYPDKESVTPDYLEAVDVLTALGVFEGNDDGSLDPQGTFTRAQAAKILTYISIGTTAANRLSHRASSFTDVATDHWANPFIEYAVEKGIINGTGNNQFAPDSPVTGAQAAKMLLVALGYGVKGEYVGPSWELKAIVDGQARGILTVDADLSAPAKREEVAQYTFNTIRPEGENNAGLQRNFLVKYTDLIGDYIKVNSNLLESGTSDFLGYEIFGLINHYEADALEYGGHTWRLRNNPGFDITGFYRTDRVIGTSTAGTPIASITNKYNAAFIAELNDTVTVYHNGKLRAQRGYDENGGARTESTYIASAINAWLDSTAPDVVAGDPSVVFTPAGPGGTPAAVMQDATKAYAKGYFVRDSHIVFDKSLYRVRNTLGSMFTPDAWIAVGTVSGGQVEGLDTINFEDVTVLGTSIPSPIYNAAGVIIDLIDTGDGAGGYDGKADKIIVIEKEVRTVAALPSLNAMTNLVSLPGVITTSRHKDLIDYPADIAVKDVVLTYE
ncbi:MAG: S-layer homology domain-containing protein, partial [Oscillospiraceae bacterium]|nr:S-layer homology domain-containing protein [Oscillospiraceae bacterium]